MLDVDFRQRRAVLREVALRIMPMVDRAERRGVEHLNVSPALNNLIWLAGFTDHAADFLERIVPVLREHGQDRLADQALILLGQRS